MTREELLKENEELKIELANTKLELNNLNIDSKIKQTKNQKIFSK